MRALVLVIALAASAFAYEVPFYGKPPPVLLRLWTGVGENLVNTAWFAQRCRGFVKQHSPEAVVPHMLADFVAYPSEAKGFTYSYILCRWPQKRVLQILEPYRHSRDHAISEIAEEFHDEVLSPD